LSATTVRHQTAFDRAQRPNQRDVTIWAADGQGLSDERWI
jgi:hypothetical protein